MEPTDASEDPNRGVEAMNDTPSEASRPDSSDSSERTRASTAGTRAGVGFSRDPSSRSAGMEAARKAVDRAGADGGSTLVFLFATSKHDPAALRDGVREVVGADAPLVGGSAVGIITNDRLGYEGHEAGVAVIDSEQMEVDVLWERGLPDEERAVGEALGRKVAGNHCDEDPNLLLLYDIVKEQRSEGMSLNMATPLLAGMEEALGEWPVTAGGGLLGDLQWNPTFQFVDDRIERHTAIATVLHGGVRMDTTIMRGCKPSSGYHTVTKADGNVVLELDGKPTADLVGELMGHGADSGMWDEYPLFITLGINRGEKYGEYREDDYAVRLCMDVDRERRGLVFFGDDMVPGTEVQLMRRNIEFDYLEERSRGLLDRVRADGRRPFLALYVDCAGRAASISATEGEEAEEVQEAVGDQVPLLGWYVGCEIARAGGAMESHNWTGILCVLSE